MHIDWTASAESFIRQDRNRAAAIEELADGDPRPLLIYLSDHKSDAKVTRLLTAALNSERFQLASKWFHCVQVSSDVLNEGHAYHALFRGKHPARLVLASRDGKRVVPFLGTAQKKVNWSGIAGVLKKDYKKDPTSAVKAIERLLFKFDALDNRRKELQAQLARAAKSNQRDRIKSIEKQIATNEKDRTGVFAKKTKLEDLGLRSATRKTD